MAARWVVTGLVLVALALLGWVLLAPQQLGGPLAVVSTYGDSMLPTYTASDLVVVMEADDYDVGDIVAYRSEKLDGTVVLHRIVDVDDDGYITQGDNNAWLDPDRPTDDAIMGTARLRVPGAGRLLELPTPVRATAIAALALGALVGGRAAQRRRVRRPDGSTPAVHLLPAARRRRSIRRRPRSEDDADRRRGFAWVGWPLQVALAAALVALLSLLLALAAFTRPTTGQGELDYRHRGEFAYASDAPSGVVYPDGQVETGDPVFLSLVDTLEPSFDYTFDGPSADVQAAGQLWVEVANGSGWSNRSRLGDEQEGTDGTLLLEGQLDISQLQRTLQRVQEQTGVGVGGATITVTAEVEVAGTVAGEPIADRFAPLLSMQLNEHRLTLAPDAGKTDDAELNGNDTDGADENGDVLRTQYGSVTVAGAEPSRLEFAGQGINVLAARRLAVALFVLAVLALAAACVAAARQGDLHEAARVTARYGRRLVEVEAVQTPAGYGVVDVRDVETLVALADRIDRPVLHQQSGWDHTYLVEGDATVYRYRLQTSPSDSAPVEATR